MMFCIKEHLKKFAKCTKAKALIVIETLEKELKEGGAWSQNILYREKAGVSPKFSTMSDQQ